MRASPITPQTDPQILLKSRTKIALGRGTEVSSDYCYQFLCFVPLDANAPKFFGFSEFLSALALIVLAWTTTDVRYRFRVMAAPLPLQGSRSPWSQRWAFSPFLQTGGGPKSGLFREDIS